MFFRTVRSFVFLTALTGLLFCSPAMSQVKDAGLWTSVNFEAKVVKKLTATLTEEVRFNENITEAGAFLTDVGLTYKLNKYFKFSINYRFIQRRTIENYYSLRHRVYADVKYEKKFKPFEFQYRIRFQDRYADIGSAPGGMDHQYYLRNKLSLKWDTDKSYTPYISSELFSPLNYPRYNAFTGMRTSAGVEYSFTKHHKADIYYMIQKEFNVSNPLTEFVLGLGYFYKL